MTSLKIHQKCGSNNPLPHALWSMIVWCFQAHIQPPASLASLPCEPQKSLLTLERWLYFLFLNMDTMTVLLSPTLTRLSGVSAYKETNASVMIPPSQLHLTLPPKAPSSKAITLCVGWTGRRISISECGEGDTNIQSVTTTEQLLCRPVRKLPGIPLIPKARTLPGPSGLCTRRTKGGCHLCLYHPMGHSEGRGKVFSFFFNKNV